MERIPAVDTSGRYAIESRSRGPKAVNRTAGGRELSHRACVSGDGRLKWRWLISDYVLAIERKDCRTPATLRRRLSRNRTRHLLSTFRAGLHICRGR